MVEGFSTGDLSNAIAVAQNIWPYREKKQIGLSKSCIDLQGSCVGQPWLPFQSIAEHKYRQCRNFCTSKAVSATQLSASSYTLAFELPLLTVVFQLECFDDIALLNNTAGFPSKPMTLVCLNCSRKINIHHRSETSWTHTVSSDQPIILYH